MTVTVIPTGSPIARRTASPPDRVWPLSVGQYHAMIQTGILTEDDPVELLEGYLVPKMPKRPRHRVTTRLIRLALESQVPPGWYVDSQEPITTADSEPEPDIMVIRGDTRDYLDRHPGPTDLALVVEVSDATLERDRSLKLRIYASAGMPVYWIANLADGRIEVYTDPSGPTESPSYRDRRSFGREDAIPLMIDGVEVARIAVGELLP